MGWDNGATQSVGLMLPVIPGAVLPSGATAPLAGALCAARPPRPKQPLNGSVGEGKEERELAGACRKESREVKKKYC